MNLMPHCIGKVIMRLFKNSPHVVAARHIVSVKYTDKRDGLLYAGGYTSIKKVLLGLDIRKMVLEFVSDDLETTNTTSVTLTNENVLHTVLDDELKIARIPFDKGVILYQEIDGKDTGVVLYFAQ